MTNLERWRQWTRHLFSPDSFVNFGWYYVVAAALQRRVWYGSLTGDPLFPNPYIVFVADAGAGKGLVLGKCNELLKHHRKSSGNEAEDLKKPKLLFPCGPDDLTYEKLCEQLSSSSASYRYNDNTGRACIYQHASMQFVLEELGSLFKRRHNDSMNKIMLTLYDCKDYDYLTKHQGEARIRKPCLALLAGCTPNFLPEGVKQGILEDGTVSRMIFIYETEPRSTKFFLGQPDEKDLAHRDVLLDHIKKLSTMFGPITLEPGVEDYLEGWFATVWKEKVHKCTPKMRTYYARSRVHVLKMAMAMHFSDNFSLSLSVADCAAAIELLDSIEDQMARCFSAAGRNLNNKLMNEMLRFISLSTKTSLSEAELLDQFQNDLTYSELSEILSDLAVMGKLNRLEGGKWSRKL